MHHHSALQCVAKLLLQTFVKYPAKIFKCAIYTHTLAEIQSSWSSQTLASNFITLPRGKVFINGIYGCMSKRVGGGQKANMHNSEENTDQASQDLNKQSRQ